MYELKRDDVLDDYRRFLKVERGLNETTIEQHTTMLRVFLDRYEQIRPPQELAKEFQEHLMDEGYSNSHVNNTMKAIDYYYEFHGEQFDFNRLNRRKKLPETLSENQVKRILYACDTYRDFAIMKTLTSSGVRASELCDLDVVDADLDNRTLLIRQGKFDKDGYAKISDTCAEAISQYLERRDDDADPLFLSRTGDRLTRNGLLQLVKRRARSAGIEQNVTVHMFRHYFATKMIENGADISIVKELLRHDDITSTMKYLHISGEALSEQYDRYVDDV
ncbi:integrase/recombinase XerD [Halogeometricum rufum]|uniref:Integrase/recombinase XerD n=1 Tax=Halogeometricum rufum TaxID=553469 RepID=A0A1I6G8M4_9EURY|nr:site-specific tyrosine recombinase/integron integrase [Halogeometricum rufum]SFR38534.1 integrase/recombinase XerD [Halogeometricum rufum]